MVKRSVKDGTKVKEVPKRAPLYPMPIKPGNDWKKVHEAAKQFGAPEHSELVESHIGQTKESIKAKVEKLVYTLDRKPIGKWTAEEIEQAKELLGFKGINVIRERQRKRRLGR